MLSQVHSLLCSRFSRLSRLESIANTPFEFLEPRTTRRARTRASSSFTALGSHPGGEGKPSPWTLPRTASGLQGTLPFLFAIFARFAVIFSSELQRTLRLNSMNREQRERREQGGTNHTTFRGFRAFRGENSNSHSFLFLLASASNSNGHTAFFIKLQET